MELLAHLAVTFEDQAPTTWVDVDDQKFLSKVIGRCGPCGGVLVMPGVGLRGWCSSAWDL